MAKRRAASSKKLLTLKHSPVQDTVVAESEQNVAAAASAEAVRQSIAEAAYFKAEKRGFASGCDVDDWLAAEAEITGCSLQQSAPAAELH